MDKNRWSRLLRLVCVLSFLWIVLAPLAEVEARTIRVGFFGFKGYHDLDEQQRRDGYGYTFLQLLNRYTDWTYDYVGYDKSWQEMQQALENGEIDLLTSAQKTPAREARFAYSEVDIGSSSVIFTVSEGNGSFVQGDFRTYDKAKVGMLRGNSRNEAFTRFAESHDFTFTPVYYDDDEQMVADLQAGGKIDALVSSNLRRVSNEWILEQFNTSPFYAIVRKDDYQTLAELNRALTQMDLDMPDWRLVLARTYYAPKNGGSVAFNKQEQEYLSGLERQKKVFTVLVNPDRAPYSWFEQGEAQGIIPRVFREIARRTGLEYKFLETKTRQDYERLVNANQADIVCDAGFDLYWGEAHNYRLTDPFLETTLSRVTRKNYQEPLGRMPVCAVVRESGYVMSGFLGRQYREDTVPYDSLHDCVTALLEDKAEETYMYTYSAQKMLYEDVRNRMKMTILPQHVTKFSLAVSRRDDYRLANILDKTVHSLSDTYLQNIVVDETRFNLDNGSVISFVYDQPLVVLAVLLLLVLLAAGLVLMTQRSRNAERERLQAETAKKADEAKNLVLQDALSTARQASEAKSIFLSRMSHEIRTPLNAVLGYMTMARLEEGNQARVNDCIDKCELAARQLLGIINDVLDLASIENGKMKLSRQEFNLGEVLDEVKNLYESQAAAKGIDFETGYGQVAQETVVGDPLRLKQILLNLVSNAVKFTHRGGQVQMLVTRAGATERQLRLKFVIRDNGIGMSEVFLSQLFEPFSQATPATAQKYGGSGLGLSITRNLVTMMQGSLDVVSQPGAGSTFTVILGLEKSLTKAGPEVKPVPSGSRRLLVPQDLRGMKVLLAEDNSMNRDIATNLLLRAGIEVTQAEDGGQAVEKFLASKPGELDLILMDIQMPVLTGYEAAKKIRASNHPLAGKIPIIAMTANAFNEDVAEALACGMNWHLAKPIDMRKFYEVLRDYGQLVNGPS